MFSEGTAECHTVQYTGHEAHVVQRKTLTSDELSKLRAVLENQELPNVQKRYELVNLVVDSWMEWNIAVPHDGVTQRIQVLNFSPAEPGEKKKPYPYALVKLGCSIWKLRFEIYGDEIYGNTPRFLAKGCKNAFTTPSVR